MSDSRKLWALSLIVGEGGQSDRFVGVFSSPTDAENYANSITAPFDQGSFGAPARVLWRHEYPTLWSGFIQPQMIGDIHAAWWSIREIEVNEPLEWIQREVKHREERKI